MSFRKHHQKIRYILQKFSHKYAVKIIKLANVGNHLHLHIQLKNRQTYKPFIRAVTAAIMLAVTGLNRWATQQQRQKMKGKKFWDLRPWTRILKSFKEHRYLQNYLDINRLEGHGYTKTQARFLFYWDLYRGMG